MVLVLLFLPGTWIFYGVSRWLLNYSSLPPEDKIVLSLLAALVYLFTALLRTWEMWQRAQQASIRPDAGTPPPAPDTAAS